MALTIGTDAYVEADFVTQYWADRGVDWSGVADPEPFIRRATDYIDRNFEFIGEPVSPTQRLKWPRVRAYVGSTELPQDIPWQIQEATAIAADLYRQGVDLDGVVSDSSAVTMEKVDVITIQYDSSRRVRGGAIPTPIFQLLQPLTLNRNRLLRA